MAREKNFYRWTPERENVLRTLWPDRGIPFYDIRFKLGDPPDHVLYLKARDLGLGKRHSGKGRKPPPKGQTTHRGNGSSLLQKIKRMQGGAQELPSSPRLTRDKLPAVHKDDKKIPKDRRCQLLDLRSGHCKWPVGYPGDKDFFFCNDTADVVGPYCAAHRKRAYQ